MHQNKGFLLIAILAWLLSSCIKTFEPEIESEDAVKFVVSGQVATDQEIQHIAISMTSSIRKPEYLPVSGCQVKVIDEKGNFYTATDMQDGNYNFYVPETALAAGSRFMVDIITQDGMHIVSDFDQMQTCPEVDSVYYIVEDLPTINPKIFIKGVRFYVDLDAENFSSHYYRWEGIETWEYHMTWPREWWYDGKIHHIFPPDYSRFVCWRTAIVKNVFTLSTDNLSKNVYHRFPLHYVDNHFSARLVYGYSLLIRQYALSEEAYAYWEKLRINSSDQGGLYEKQPLAVRGNLHNVTNPDQSVLGFFSASAAKSKRIFVSNVPVPNEYDPACNPMILRKGFADLDPRFYPTYMLGDAEGFRMASLDTECVDCLTVGGTNVKPSFWPN